MEKFSFNFFTYFSRIAPSELIALKKPQILLPIFYIYAFTKAFFINQKKIEIIHLGDALLSPLGVLLKMSKNVPVTVTVHALDVIFPNRLYQFLIPRCLNRLDKIICVSRETMNECIIRGINPELCTVIPNGIDKFYPIKYLEKKKMLKYLINIEIGNNKILLSVGRLIERKGFHYFIKNTFPCIRKEFPGIIYLIVGSGKLKNKLNDIIMQLGFENEVFILQKIDDNSLNSLYQISDIFIMPNIPVKGDMEGFGIVALEASSSGLPVVASNIEGIKDAIIDNKNGFLIDPYDNKRYIEVILDLLKNDTKRINFGREAMEITSKTYNWKIISESYLQTFNQILYSHGKN
ncbi:MAG: glycosyltransferase family 4 protein [Candidatus Methanoperedens sp.]|nr:glycosyltransferase family 4 protein [Candidatus Methanoperedens sp.]